MVPRGQPDITYADIFRGLYYALINAKSDPKNALPSNQLTCLSVRTGFDLTLSALNYPPGTEIIVTGISIPDMFAIITAHGLAAVPLCLNKHTLSHTPQQVEAAITPATKAILITHLFGGIMDTAEIVAIAKKHNLLIIEDCAQAFIGNGYMGNPQSDVVMFSFGFIKTNTTLSGAVLQINQPGLYNQVAQLNAQLPKQPSGVFIKKVWKALLAKILTTKLIYTLFYKITVGFGKDFDQALSGFTRGFPGADILQSIRFGLSDANKKLLGKRLAMFNPQRINKRKQVAHDILLNVPDAMKIGSFNLRHSYWVLPVQTKDTDALIVYLRTNGFDATKKASSLVALPASIAPDTDLLLEDLVYLPMYPEMKRRDRFKLSDLLKDYNIFPSKNVLNPYQND
jgi:dTDP-4-amino-4,6-dideoxygalactose transaminase